MCRVHFPGFRTSINKKVAFRSVTRLPTTCQSYLILDVKMAQAWLVFGWGKMYFLCESSFCRQVLLQVPFVSWVFWRIFWS